MIKTHDKQSTALMPEQDALEYLLVHCEAVQETMALPLEQAFACYLAEDIRASLFVPPWDNSAMDGYAVNTQSLNADGRNGQNKTSLSVSLAVSQRIPAGKSPLALQAGTAARIFTGAPVPEGADAVVIQEDCVVENHLQDVVMVKVPVKVEKGANIRRKGEDIKPGDLLLKQGSRIRPQEMGLLASLGYSEVSVYRKLKVAILSSGDELIDPGQKPLAGLAPGQIFNSNRYTLAGLVNAMGFELVDLGIVADDPAATEAALLAAAREADCVISTGGVSVGEEDHIKAALEKLGRLDIWKLAIKPGKPLAFGFINGDVNAINSDGHDHDTPFFGLPGNPAAVLITFCVFVRPYLMKLAGGQTKAPLMINAKAGFDRHNKGQRKEYLRARLELDSDGQQVVNIFANQSSGMLSSSSWANGFVPIKPAQVIVSGDLIEFLPMSEWLT